MSGRRGFTVVEVVIAASVLAIVVALSLGLLGSMSEQVADSTVISDLRARGRNASVLLKRELRSIAGETVSLSDPDPDDTDSFRAISYRQVIRFEPGATPPEVLDPLPPASPHRIVFELEGGESANGVDDDGDGLIDEGRVFLERGGARIAEVARDVRSFKVSLPSGASSVFVGDTHLEVQFTLQQRGRRAGVVETYAEGFNVGLRN